MIVNDRNVSVQFSLRIGMYNVCKVHKAAFLRTRRSFVDVSQLLPLASHFLSSFLHLYTFFRG